MYGTSQFNLHHSRGIQFVPTMEPTTIIGGGLALFGGKKLIGQFLGPTADYFGEGLKNYSKKGCENVSRVFDIAIRNIGRRIENPGQVPPKVLKEVLNGGFFCDDQLTAEYLGGVLASSRTEIGRDDRGAAIAGLIGRLSAYQIRCHYLMYAGFHKEFEGEDGNLGLSSERKNFSFFIPMRSFLRSMDFTLKENVENLIPHIMNGLAREGLMEATWGHGPADFIKQNYQCDVVEEGLVWTPSAVGIELFMWANGDSDCPIGEFLCPKFTFAPVQEIPPLTGIVRRHLKVIAPALAVLPRPDSPEAAPVQI